MRTDVKIDLKTLEELSRRRAQGLRPRRRRAARRVDAAARRVRRVPARRRLRDPPRHRLPEHGLRAPAVPGGAEGRDVRLDPRERARKSGSRRTPKSSSSTRRARRRSARSRSGCGASRTPSAQAIGQSLEERFTFLMKQLKIDDTAAAVQKFVKACRTCRSIASAEIVGGRRQDHGGGEEGRRAGRLGTRTAAGAAGPAGSRAARRACCGTRARPTECRRPRTPRFPGLRRRAASVPPTAPWPRRRR